MPPRKPFEIDESLHEHNFYSVHFEIVEKWQNTSIAI